MLLGRSGDLGPDRGDGAACGTSRSPRPTGSRSTSSAASTPTSRCVVNVVAYSILLQHPAHRRRRAAAPTTSSGCRNAYFAGLRRHRQAAGRREDAPAPTRPSVGTARWFAQFTRNGGAVGRAPADRRGHRAVLQRRPSGPGAASDPSWTLRAVALVTRADGDTLRPLLAHRRRRRKLARATPGFDPNRSGSGATTQPTTCRASTSTTSAPPAGCSRTATGSRSTTPRPREAFEYLVRPDQHRPRSPPASDTNDNGDFSRNQFLSGPDGAVSVRHLQPGR